MDFTYLIVVLALGTMLAVLILAIIGKARIEARMQDDEAPKSTLATDKRSDGKPADV